MRSSKSEVHWTVAALTAAMMLLVGIGIGVTIGASVGRDRHWRAGHEKGIVVGEVAGRNRAFEEIHAWARAAGCLERHTGYDGQPVDVWTCAPVPTWRPQMVGGE